MIVEGAFFKLPELLLGHDSPEGQYEATLASHLAMAVLLELNARNIPMPQRCIHVERPYPVEKAGPAARSDLYVDLDGVFPSGPGLSHYGFHVHNWIECKFYAKIGRARGTTTKVSDVGRLTRDLLRLCLFVKKKVSDVQANGRYLVAVFNRRPSEYLAFHRQSPDPDRAWLQELLIPGRHQIEIPLKGGMKLPPKYVPLEAVFIVILWKCLPTVVRKSGHPNDSFRLAQHLPERQPGAQAVSRVSEGQAKRSLDTGEHRAIVEQVLSPAKGTPSLGPDSGPKQSVIRLSRLELSKSERTRSMCVMDGR